MKQSFLLGSLVSIQLAAALCIQLLILRTFGAGAVTDAYIAAQTLPLILTSVITVSLQNIWQPRLAVNINIPRDWRISQSTAHGQALAFFGGTALVVTLSTGAWSRLLFPGLELSQLKTLSQLTPPLMLAALFNCHSAISATSMRAKNKFAMPEAVQLTTDIFMLIVLFWAISQRDIRYVAWTLLGRATVCCLILHCISGRPSISIKRGLSDLPSLRQLKPLVLGSSLYKLSPMVDRYWGSLATAGSITALSFAQNITGALAKIFERALCQPHSPSLARAYAEKDFLAMRSTYRRCVTMVTLGVAVFTAGLVLIQPIWSDMVAFAFHLDSDFADQLWWLCILLLGQLHVAASGTIVVACFYAMGDMLTPTRIGSIAFVCGLFIKSFAFLAFGIKGLAVGASVYYLGSMTLNCLVLEKRIAIGLAQQR